MSKPEESAHGIAAFTLAQIALWSQIKSGSLPVEVAAKMLRDGIAGNAKGNAVNQRAAQLLQTVLDMLTKGERPAPN